MQKIILSILAFACSSMAVAQPQTAFCDSVKLLMDQSAKGFKEVRYNEKEGPNGTASYSTVLKVPGFRKAAVQIGSVTPVRQKTPITTTYLLAMDEQPSRTAAISLLDKIAKDIIKCRKPTIADTSVPAGFVKYKAFVYNGTGGNITIETGLLAGNGNTIFFRLYNRKTGTERGGMSKPPAPSLNTGPRHFNDPCSLMAALVEAGVDGFAAITGEKQANNAQDERYIMHLQTEHFGCRWSLEGFSEPRIRKTNYSTSASYEYRTIDKYDDLAQVKQVYNATVRLISSCTFRNLNFINESGDNDSNWWLIRKVSYANGKQYSYRIGLRYESAVGGGYILLFQFVRLD